MARKGSSSRMPVSPTNLKYIIITPAAATTGDEYETKKDQPEEQFG